jgi:hypothetical protein
LATTIFAISAGLDKERFWIAHVVTAATFFIGGFFLARLCNREAGEAYRIEYRRLGGVTDTDLLSATAPVGNRIERTGWWRRRFGYRYGVWDVAIPTVMAIGFAAMLLTVMWGFATGRLPAR